MSPETANLVLNRDRNISPITLEACETIASLNCEYAVELRISKSTGHEYPAGKTPCTSWILNS